jgi:hypothetical protein
MECPNGPAVEVGSASEITGEPMGCTRRRWQQSGRGRADRQTTAPTEGWCRCNGDRQGRHLQEAMKRQPMFGRQVEADSLGAARR